MERRLKISSLGYASRLKICDASVSGSSFAVKLLALPSQPAANWPLVWMILSLL